MAGFMSRGPPNGSVYVCNLPPGTDETMLAEYFGTIGLLKVWGLPRRTKGLGVQKSGYIGTKLPMNQRVMRQSPMKIRMLLQLQ
ncbi:Os07g0296200 [Oryza sativa Japonica Group]|uniref:Os07g0296200 protein n=1 Tax=Oryza sativa subsp. japonica TaxID=39947 RepID=A0A0P0X5A3_ORYSJ|nr:hypothetical protein EE612_038535 [Oryza sativa]BAT01059.1 Os07g0296200 [Oryza sativa Japonica Group]